MAVKKDSPVCTESYTAPRTPTRRTQVSSLPPSTPAKGFALNPMPHSSSFATSRLSSSSPISSPSFPITPSQKISSPRINNFSHKSPSIPAVYNDQKTPAQSVSFEQSRALAALQSQIYTQLTFQAHILASSAPLANNIQSPSSGYSTYSSDVHLIAMAQAAAAANGLIHTHPYAFQPLPSGSFSYGVPISLNYPVTYSTPIVHLQATPESLAVCTKLDGKENMDKGAMQLNPGCGIKPVNQRALASALQNPNGTTNVYIRGLPPNTTDESLYKMVSEFGNVVSSKAIVDSGTNTCKGFGFANYTSKEEAADCITGLIPYGYQVSFAKESFSSRLKHLHDPSSTNLYFSALPLDISEKDLEEAFAPYQIVSNRILRDENGNSRGVGFARMTDRASAELVVENFHNKPLKKDGDPIQIRFADSTPQKRLKQQTAKRRQFRAQEYMQMTSHLQQPINIYSSPLMYSNDYITDSGTFPPSAFLPYESHEGFLSNINHNHIGTEYQHQIVDSDTSSPKGKPLCDV